MPSSKNLQNLKTICIICNYITFTWFPITYKTQQQAFQIYHKNSKQLKFFILLNIMNLFYITVQFVSSLYNHNTSTLIQLLFRGLPFFMNVGVWICGVGFYWHALEFCALLNCLVSNPGGLVFEKASHFRQSDNLVTFIIMSTQFISFITIFIFIPTVDISFAIYSQSLSTICKVLSVVFTVVRLPCFLSGCGIGLLTVSICFIALKELCDNLNDLQILQSKTFGNTQNINRNWLLESYYRKFQVFALVLNECFRTNFWPTFQIIGAMLCIGLLYTLLIYRTLITLSVKITILLLLLAALCFNCFLLDFGSKSLIISTRILRRGKAGLEHDDRKWLSKFVKSCSPIVVRVGSIHEMDRERWPCFVRFILQRTFFLVVKSKD